MMRPPIYVSFIVNYVVFQSAIKIKLGHGLVNFFSVDQNVNPKE